MYRLLLLSLTLHCVSSSTNPAGSCRAARKCCDGKDADCVVQTSAINAIISQDEEPCYCDHGWMEVGDCCSDFKDYCGGNAKIKKKVFLKLLGKHCFRNTSQIV